jgi:S-adenosylmethionine synthetase
MDLTVGRLEAGPLEEQDREIVERKGLGHPDSICDALAEQFSISLSRFYLDHFDSILHHNVDKALLYGGAARPFFGGGDVLEPIEIFLTGRAIRSFRGVEVPIEELAEKACRGWLREHFHALDADEHVKIRCLVRPGSQDLVDLYQRQREAGAYLANDTSCGVGYAPLSQLETVVHHVEQRLNSPAEKLAHPEVGEDIKVMGVRVGDKIRLTVGCAFIGQHLRDVDDYMTQKRKLADRAFATARSMTSREVEVEVNTADDPSRNCVYLTVTGTSAEAGDDGQAGRGNRVNGLITPYRPMTLESVAGKNPINHVGKLYNLMGGLIAAGLVDAFAEVTEAQCYLVSQIGRPICEPQLADVKVRCEEKRSPTELAPRIDQFVRDHLRRVDSLWQELMEGSLRLDRWPLRA